VEFTGTLASEFMAWLLMQYQVTGRNYNNYLIDYRSFFNSLVKAGYLGANPFHSIDKQREKQTAKRAFTDKELTAYIQYVYQYDYPFYILSGLAYYCAMRPVEIVRCRVQDISAERRQISIPAGKGNQARVTPIPDAFLQELLTYLEGYPGGYFVCSAYMKPGTVQRWPTRIAERFKRIRARLGLPADLKFYSLKDTVADRLLAAGYSVQEVRDLFGHSSVAVTDAYIKRMGYKHLEVLRRNFPGMG
jgi:integrase